MVESFFIILVDYIRTPEYDGSCSSKDPKMSGAVGG